MLKLNQKGVAHILLLFILLAGIIGGVWLVTNGNPLKLFSHAGGAWLTIKDKNGIPYPYVGSVIQIKSPNVKLEFYAPYGLKPAVSAPNKVYSVSYKIAENPNDFTAIKPKLFTKDPTQVDWTFKPNPGAKFIWEEVVNSDGTTIRNTAQIQLIVLTPSCTLQQLTVAFGTKKGDAKFNSSCDLNNDTMIDIVDFSLLLQAKSKSCPLANFNLAGLQAAFGTKAGDAKFNECYDLNGDGFIDIVDFSVFSKVLSQRTAAFVCTACGADINKDGGVDIVDYSYLASCYNKKATDVNKNGKSCAPADIDGSGTVDKADNTCLQSQFGKQCSAVSSSKRVFVTSSPIYGNLKSAGSKFGLGAVTSGLDGADKICQGSANIAKLGGTWKAWLSDSATSVSSRLNHSTVPYKLLNGTTVANNWADLTDGVLQSQINLTEYGKLAADAYVWTNTSNDGSILSKDTKYNCNNWVSNDYFSKGTAGLLKFVYNWTNYTSLTCINPENLYCFEQ